MPRGVVEDYFVLSLHTVLREHRRGRASAFVRGVSLDAGRESVRVFVGSNEQVIPLLQHRHNLAGARWWFLCDCGVRVFTLYRPIANARYACRSCYQLRYRSENFSRAGRLEHRAAKLAKRIGGSLLREPARPKGMWASTFAHLASESEVASMRALAHSLGAALV